ncbi:hypothetical protein [Chitinophaga sp.]|uniref:hypothetical protein n=1 Tax=Chitinophaga sp. TaxID=1869181 RepID=UPI002616297A|nr:hypothetical protein [uncultured Chitinophaga sp.]
MQHTFSRLIAPACVALSLLAAACGKEERLNPPLLPDAYQLPQGNQPIDDSIVNFKNKYGTYFLYKFTHLDFAYTPTGMLSDTAAVGDPAYLKAAYDFFRLHCLAYYPEDFRKKTLPFRIYLSAAVGAKGPGGTIIVKKGFSCAAHMLAIGWTNARLETLSPEEKKATIAAMHRYYFHRALLGGSIPVPKDFLALMPASMASMTEANKYLRGMLEVQHVSKADPLWDLATYVEAVTGKTTAELEATILSPQVDRNGLVRKKYNIVLKHFKEEYNIDLAAIGNLP